MGLGFRKKRQLKKDKEKDYLRNKARWSILPVETKGKVIKSIFKNKHNDDHLDEMAAPSDAD